MDMMVATPNGRKPDPPEVATADTFMTDCWHGCAVIILAFTIPKAYELKKDEVDRFAAKAQHHSKVCSEGTPC